MRGEQQVMQHSAVPCCSSPQKEQKLERPGNPLRFQQSHPLVAHLEAVARLVLLLFLFNPFPSVSTTALNINNALVLSLFRIQINELGSTYFNKYGVSYYCEINQ